MGSTRVLVVVKNTWTPVPFKGTQFRRCTQGFSEHGRLLNGWFPLGFEEQKEHVLQRRHANTAFKNQGPHPTYQVPNIWGPWSHLRFEWQRSNALLPLLPSPHAPEVVDVSDIPSPDPIPDLQQLWTDGLLVGLGSNWFLQLGTVEVAK